MDADPLAAHASRGRVVDSPARPGLLLAVEHEESGISINESFHDFLVALQRERSNGEPFVCLNDRFGQWSVGVSKWFRVLFDDSGVGTRWGTTHRFRHTFATTLLRAGVDLATLRDLMGHSDISVTSRYLAATPQRREAVAALATLPGPEDV